MESQEYVQNAIRTESIPTAIVVNEFVLNDLMQMIIALANAADLVKKRIFYGKDINVDKYHAYLSQLKKSVDDQLDMVDQVPPEVLNQVFGVDYIAGMNHGTAARLAGGRPEKLNIRLLHSALGIHTEAGEMFEALIKQYRGEELDKVNFAEELGDVDWYKAIGHDETGVDESTMREANIAKLRKRYPDKFFNSDHATTRDLDAERQVLENNLPNLYHEPGL